MTEESMPYRHSEPLVGEESIIRMLFFMDSRVKPENMAI